MSTSVDSRRVKAAQADTFRPDIQGLRAVAVIVVILDHLIGWPSGGFVGVDVFFVISGFLITGLMLREHERTGQISWAGFYRRRIRRIMPAAVVCLAGTVAASYFIYRTARFDAIRTDAIWSFFFGANWHYAIVGTDYLESTGPVSPLQHFWSLSVEEQFYVVWPLLIIGMLGLVGRPLRIRGRSVRRPLAVVMAAGVAASFGWAMYDTATSPTWAYFSTFTRVWELAAGALLALAAPRISQIPAYWRPVLSWTGLAMIAASMFVITTSSPFPGPWAALPVGGAVLVIAAGIGVLPAFSWPLRNQAAAYVGKISYSLYLWHFPVIILLAAVLSRDSAAYYPLAIAGMIVLSVASFHFVEDPVRRSSWLKPDPVHHRRRRRPSRIAVLGLTALAVLGIVVVVLTVLALRPLPVVTVASTLVAGATGSSASQSPAGDPDDAQIALSAQINAALDATAWPELTPTIDEVVSAGFAGGDNKGCAPVAPGGRDCNFTGVDPAKLVIVAGDSVATAWMPGLRAALEPAGFIVKNVTFPGCPFANDETFGADQERADLCGAHREVVVDSINAAQPRLLIVSDRASYRFKDLPDGSAQTGKWQESFSALYERVRTNVGGLVILGAPPQGKNPAECATRLAAPADCEYDVNATSTLYAGVEEALAAKLGGTYINPTPWFCVPQRGCHVRRNHRRPAGRHPHRSHLRHPTRTSARGSDRRRLGELIGVRISRQAARVRTSHGFA